jgi:uncharacterized RDD family membrane protein YckC
MGADHDNLSLRSEVTTAEQPVVRFELAKRSSRLAAAIVDGLCAAVPVLGLYIVFGFVLEVTTRRGMPPGLELAGPLLAFLAFVCINAFFLRRNGQTLGKKLGGIRIASLDGNVPGLAKVILVRYFPIWLVSLIPFVGSFLILIDLLFIFRSDRRCIHDWLAGTRVITVS